MIAHNNLIGSGPQHRITGMTVRSIPRRPMRMKYRKPLRTQKLGDDFDWPFELYETTSPVEFPDYTPVPDWEFKLPGSISTPPTFPEPSSSIDWSGIWKGISSAIGPAAQAAGSIIRATRGQPEPVPAGFVRNAAGQIIPFSATAGNNWILPAILIGGGALFLATRSKRRR